MTNMTARRLVTEALHECGHTGVGQTPLADDINAGFLRLNIMISQWAQKRWMIYRLVEGVITSTGAQTYTIGPGGDVALDADGRAIALRPDRLENGNFLRQLNSQPGQPVDYPLTLIESKEDYSTIGLKKLNSFSYMIFYDPAFPLGVLYPWPIPQASIYELHVMFKNELPEFATLDDLINLPPEYNGALLYNLAIRLASYYNIPIPPTSPLPGLARDGMNVVRNSNTAITTLKTPQALRRPGLYNIYGDNFY